MLKPLKVLVVDEEELLRRMTASMLGARGFAVRTAATLEEAVELAARHDFDVAVIDLEREAQRALTFLERAEQRGCVPCRVILCTNEVLTPSVAARFSDVVHKPFAFDRLIEAVRGARARRKPMRSGVFPKLTARGAGAQRSAQRGSSAEKAAQNDVDLPAQPAVPAPRHLRRVEGRPALPLRRPARAWRAPAVTARPA